MNKRGMIFVLIGALMLSLGFTPAMLNAKSADAKTADAAATETQAKSAAVQQIDINKADVEMLTQIPGIGPKTAEAIVAYRKDVGTFKTIEELVEVKGIGPKKLESIRPYLQKI
jgi:competence protein ComEA